MTAFDFECGIVFRDLHILRTTTDYAKILTLAVVQTENIVEDSKGISKQIE
jgi:hypothetical protein